MDTTTPENKEKSARQIKNEQIYGDENFAAWAMAQTDAINSNLEIREQASIVFNGIPYSEAYVYNRQKAINYAPPKDPEDDAEVSFGIIHEKIIAFAAIYLKYVYKRNIKVYDEYGQIIPDLGKVYDLSIEHSYRLESFKKLIALIYWEVFTQGNAFVLEDWQVKNCKNIDAYKDGKKVAPESMDYTYEFLDGLTYADGEERQERRAVSRLLDGRNVIFDNPEIEEVQDQEYITIEETISRVDAEAMYRSLSRWPSVPKNKEELNAIVPEKNTLFDASRLKDPATQVIVHRRFSKTHNMFNFALNGVWMLPMKTPMSIFYPRMNYPLTNVPAERLTGSIYCRSIPAKTKFNADFIDWALKGLAYKFEQGKTPAIVTKGRYTLTKDFFKGGQVTHGIEKDAYWKADPDNKGVTGQDVSFVQLMKGIVEQQTTSILSAGDLSANATAEEIATLDQNQKEKLGYLLDGLVNGFTDMYMRRSETIESKYTIKQRETVVDGKKVNVYQNFTVSSAGVENIISFDDSLDTPDFDKQASDEALYLKKVEDKKAGRTTRYYLANPRYIRDGKTFVDIEVAAERKKDAALEMVQMWNEFGQLMKLFGTRVNVDELQKEYLQTSNKSDSLFLSPDKLAQINKMQMEAESEVPTSNASMKDLKNNALGR